MHDVVALEREGLKGVVLLSDTFLQQGIFQASRLGLQDAHQVITLVEHPISDATPKELERKAAMVYPDIVRSLTSNEQNARLTGQGASDMCLL
eukprot:gene10235-12108_t